MITTIIFHDLCHLTVPVDQQRFASPNAICYSSQPEAGPFTGSPPQSPILSKHLCPVSPLRIPDVDSDDGVTCRLRRTCIEKQVQAEDVPVGQLIIARV